MKLEYSSNNSGGKWWLTDDNWRAMEAAGWKVDWVKDEPVGPYHESNEDRWLGALAKNASIDTDDIAHSINEWESLTGQSAADEGCNCCGQPHNFSWIDNEGGYHCLEISKQTSWSIR